MMVVSGPLLDNRKKKKGEVEEEDKKETEKDQRLPRHEVSVIFSGDTGFISKRMHKLTLRKIMSIEPATPPFQKYGKVEISFSRADPLVEIIASMTNNFHYCRSQIHHKESSVTN